MFEKPEIFNPVSQPQESNKIMNAIHHHPGGIANMYTLFIGQIQQERQNLCHRRKSPQKTCTILKSLTNVVIIRLRMTGEEEGVVSGIFTDCKKSRLPMRDSPHAP